jgi:hypothetical protein
LTRRRHVYSAAEAAFLPNWRTRLL